MHINPFKLASMRRLPGMVISGLVVCLLALGPRSEAVAQEYTVPACVSIYNYLSDGTGPGFDQLFALWIAEAKIDQKTALEQLKSSNQRLVNLVVDGRAGNQAVIDFAKKCAELHKVAEVSKPPIPPEPATPLRTPALFNADAIGTSGTCASVLYNVIGNPSPAYETLIVWHRRSAGLSQSQAYAEARLRSRSIASGNLSNATRAGALEQCITIFGIESPIPVDQVRNAGPSLAEQFEARDKANAAKAAAARAGQPTGNPQVESLLEKIAANLRTCVQSYSRADDNPFSSRHMAAVNIRGDCEVQRSQGIRVATTNGLGRWVDYFSRFTFPWQ